MCKQVKTNKAESFKKSNGIESEHENEEAMFWKLFNVQTKSKKKKYQGKQFNRNWVITGQCILKVMKCFIELVKTWTEKEDDLIINLLS